MGQNHFGENFLVTVCPPSCTLDLAPSDFWIFGHIKISFADRVLNDIDMLRDAVIEFVNQIQPSELQPIWHHWIEMAKWALVNNGDDYQE
jgi:hypothetical protein